MIFKRIHSPIGTLKVYSKNSALVAIEWPREQRKALALEESSEDSLNPFLIKVETQLNEYFEGRRKSFTLKTNPLGTEFQKKVWKALSNIPYGVTKSYGEIANEIGAPKASRAVGAANGRNPLSIVVPCHRVIGANGKLTGFAGGIDIKEKLLKLEKCL